MVKNKILGTALLSALFIMTLVAIAATAMTMRMHLDIYRTNLMINADKRYLASQAVIFWAMDRLSDKKYSFFKLLPEGQVDNFPKNLETLYPGFTMRGKLFDLQAKMNINDLEDENFQPRLNLLFEQIFTKKNAQEREALVKALAYWISPHDLDAGVDNELNNYLKLSPPYYPSRQPFKSLSELRLVIGVDAEIYQALNSVLTVLPSTVPININTASKAVLFALKKGISTEQVEEIIQARQAKGIVDANTLNALLRKIGLTNDLVTIESEYFLAISEIQNEEYKLVDFAVLKRNKDKKGKITVTLIEESVI